MMLMICKATSLGKLCVDEDAIFCPPCFDEQIYYDESMPPIYDDYCDDTFAYVESSKFSMFVDHEKNALGAGYIVEFIHDATEYYYEGGTYACRNCNNIKFPLYVLKVLTSSNPLLSILSTRFSPSEILGRLLPKVDSSPVPFSSILTLLNILLML